MVHLAFARTPSWKTPDAAILTFYDRALPVTLLLPLTRTFRHGELNMGVSRRESDSQLASLARVCRPSRIASSLQELVGRRITEMLPVLRNLFSEESFSPYRALLVIGKILLLSCSIITR